jgi:hypothetical protein
LSISPAIRFRTSSSVISLRFFSGPVSELACRKMVQRPSP